MIKISEMNIKKISWWRRLTMKWDSIIEYIEKNLENFEDDENKVLKKLFSEQAVEVANLKKQILEIQEDKINNKLVSKQFEEIKKQNNNLTDYNKDLEKRLNTQKGFVKTLEKDILEKLGPLKTIERTFLNDSLIKGKGNLGELRLKTELEKVGLAKNDYWSEELYIDPSNPATSSKIDFVLKSPSRFLNKDQKWVPIDSKVINQGIVPVGSDEYEITSEYTAAIKTQLSKMQKYLNTKITTDYGVMVIQSDNIYLKLWDINKQLFIDSISKYNIHILSPSMFIQFALSLSIICKYSENNKHLEQINKKIESLVNNVRLFADAAAASKNKLVSAHDTYFPKIQKEHEDIRSKLPNSLISKSIKLK